MDSVDFVMEIRKAVGQYVDLNVLHPFDMNALGDTLESLFNEIEEEAYDRGREEGYEDGDATGREYGYQDGYDSGYEAGSEDARSAVLTALDNLD